MRHMTFFVVTLFAGWQLSCMAGDEPVEVKLTAKPIKDCKRVLSKSDVSENRMDGSLVRVTKGAVLSSGRANFSKSVRDTSFSIGEKELTLSCHNGVQLKQGSKSKKLKKKSPGLDTVKMKLPNGMKYAIAFPYAEIKGNNAVVYYRSGCHMTGSFSGMPLALYDDNMNGAYGMDDGFSINKSTVYAPLSELLPSPTAVYSLGEIPEDASKLVFTRHDGDTGKIAVKFSGKGLEANFAFGGDKLNFTSVGKGKFLTVVPGDYQLLYGIVYCKKLKRVIAGVAKGEMQAITVDAGKQKAAVLGKPFSLIFSATRNGKKIEISPVFRIKGKAGEIYSPLKIIGTPTVAYRLSKKKIKSMGAFETG